MLRILVTVALGLVVTLTVHAEESAPVEVRGERPAPMDGRDSTIEREELFLDDDPQLKTSAGALIDLALGVRVQRSGTPGRRESVQLRGAAGHQVLILIDDVPVTSTFTSLTDLSSLSLGCIQSVEVLRGGGSTHYGSGAQGGILRLNPRADGSGETHVSVSGGSFGHLSSEFCQAVKEETWSGWVGTQLQMAEGDFPYVDANGRHRTRVNHDHVKTGVIGTVKLNSQGSGDFSGLGEVVFHERGEPGGAEFPNSLARSEELRGILALNWDHQGFAEGRWSASSGLDAALRQYTYRDVGGDDDLADTHTQLSDKRLGGRGQISYESISWLRPRLLLAGSFAQADRSNLAEGSRIEKNRTYASATSDFTFFLDDWMRLLLAGRLDWSDHRGPMVLPRAGVVLSTRGWIEGRLNYSKTFRDPSFDELYFVGTGIAGNPDLEHEDGWSVDGGISIRLKKPIRAKISVTAYRNVFKRIILFLPIDAYRVRATDDHGAITRGIEFGTQLWLDPFWLKLNHHWQDARFRDSGSKLPYRPDHRIVARIGGTWGPLEPWVGYTAQSDVTSDRFGLRSLSAYYLLDGGIRIAGPANIEVTLDARNILDRRGHVDAVHLPLPGRSFYLGFRVTR